MSKEKLNLIASLEIGTSKVAMAVGKITIQGELEILSVAQAAHKGIHQGQMVDSQEIAFAVQKVKSESEIVVGQAIESVVLTVADLSLETVHSKGVVAVKKIIGRRDIEAVIKDAQDSAQVRSDRQILHSFPQYYKVEGVRYETVPMKVKTTSLEVTTLLITVNKKNIQMAKDCLKTVGLSAREVVAPVVAAAYAVTQIPEREQGVGVIDLGGSLTHILAFKAGRVAYAATLGLGGVNFTQDLAVGLRTPITSAEKIKKHHGAALVDLVSPEEMVEIESLKGEPARLVEARLVSQILEARAEETLGLLLRKLNDEDLLTSLKSGVLLTGGASQLPGLPELGEFTFDIPIRRGESMGVMAQNPLALGPVMSAAVGLLQYMRRDQNFIPVEMTGDFFKDSITKFKSIIDNIL
jgi:cell division protein FtsA